MTNYVFQIDKDEVELLHASCFHDPRNGYCLTDWNSFSDGFSPDYTVSVISTCIHIHYFNSFYFFGLHQL